MENNNNSGEDKLYDTRKKMGENLYKTIRTFFPLLILLYIEKYGFNSKLLGKSDFLIIIFFPFLLLITWYGYIKYKNYKSGSFLFGFIISLFFSGILFFIFLYFFG